jgi:hypothetical protein
MATLRPDGFAGYTQQEAREPAKITTTLIAPPDGSFRITADVEREGYVKVSVLDERNELLAKSESLNGSMSDAEIPWPNGFSFEELGDNSIQIRFDFQDATVYSFSFAE